MGCIILDTWKMAGSGHHPGSWPLFFKWWQCLSFYVAAGMAWDASFWTPGKWPGCKIWEQCPGAVVVVITQEVDCCFFQWWQCHFWHCPGKLCFFFSSPKCNMCEDGIHSIEELFLVHCCHFFAPHGLRLQQSTHGTSFLVWQHLVAADWFLGFLFLPSYNLEFFLRETAMQQGKQY